MSHQSRLISRSLFGMKSICSILFWIALMIGSSFSQVYVNGEKRNLAVTLYDWPETSADFATNGGACGGGVKKGFVGVNLDADGKPVVGTAACVPTEITQWFRTQDLAGSTNATCYDLEITYDDQGVWVADFTNFFPLDGFLFLDPAQTIANPWNKITSNNASHNYSFTMEVDAEFVYQPGQTFDFRGDDDVFVFIDNRLVVDIGGVHGPASAAVKLDTLGLVADETYSFKIFFAERQCCGSNFKMSTSIDLKTNRNLYMDTTEVGSTINYDIYERQAWSNGSCNQVNAGAAVNPVPSTFTLTGFGIEPTLLELGESFGGITIGANEAQLTLDVDAIATSKSLESGHYDVLIQHKNDPTQNDTIGFDIEYISAPYLRFVDDQGEPILDDGELLGPWSKINYAVKVAVFLEGVHCPTCHVQISLESARSVSTLNSTGEPLNEMTLVNGIGTFWIAGEGAMENGWLEIESAATNNSLEIRPIKFKDILVSLPSFAAIYDEDGNGIADSLRLKFTHINGQKIYPDSISVSWGEEVTLISWKSILTRGEAFTLSEVDFTSEIYTGNQSAVDAFALGEFIYYLAGERIVIEQPIIDKVGPVVLYGEILSSGSSSKNLIIYLSEYIEVSGESLPLNLYEFKTLNDQVVEPTLHKWLQQGAIGRMQFTSEAEVEVGDSLRIDEQFMVFTGLGQVAVRDLAGNLVHPDNPFQRIIGKEKINIKALDLIDQVDELSQWSKGKDPWQLFLMDPEATLQNNFKNTQYAGATIDLNMGRILLADTNLDKKEMYFKWSAEVFSNLGGFIASSDGKINCTDEVYLGDCTQMQETPYIGWNQLSQNDRKVGSGVYIIRINIQVFHGKEKIQKLTHMWKMGVKR